MAIEELRQRARCWLLDLANVVYPDEHNGRLVQQAEELQQQVRLGYAELLRERRACEVLQQRIDGAERSVTALPWKVLSYMQTDNRRGAWLAALELDQLRALLEEDRLRLREAQQAYQEHAVQLAAERQRLGEMQRQLLRLQPKVRFAS